MRCLILAMGPGESAHAIGFGSFLLAHQWNVTLALVQPENMRFLKNEQQRFDIQITTTPEEFSTLLQQHQPDLLVICNSKAWRHYPEFQQIPPARKPLTICLDSNWLFNNEKYPWFPFIQWADRYFIVFPKDIYEQGLIENGGGFTIETDLKNKIEPVGFVPFYDAPSPQKRLEFRASLGIKDHEKLIFLYASGAGADFKPWIIKNLVTAVTDIQKRHPEIKVLYVGPNRPPLDPIPSWLLWHEVIDDFYEAMAASDLIFQHHGMGSLPQAVSARVPIICNIAIPGYDKLPNIHLWEVSPAAQSGVCHLHNKDDDQASITKSVEDLLFDPEKREAMRQAQERHSEKGEENAYKIIKTLLPQ